MKNRFPHLGRFQFGILLPVILLVFSGCKEQELPNEGISEAVFWLDATIGSEEVNLVAGESGYFQHTSYAQDQWGVYEFTGMLGPQGCTDCKSAFQLDIRDNRQVAQGASTDASKVLSPSSFTLLPGDATDSIIKTAFRPQLNQAEPANLTWELGDGTISNDLEPLHRYNFAANMDQAYEVCLSVTYSNGCQSRFCDEVKLPQNRCELSFEYEINRQTLWFQALPLPGGVPPYRYRWEIEGVDTLTVARPNFQFFSRGVFPVCLIVIDGNGCEAKTCKNIAIGGVSSCAANFDYELQKTFTFDSLNLSQVRLSWTNEEGTLFRSDLGKQPAGSYFRLLSAEPYENNEKGEATYRLAFEANCTLYSVGEAPIELVTKEAFMAVAVPE
ncbi:MAG: hypothetical protein AAGI38_16155 [Bacteroidota bacterium]